MRVVFQLLLICSFLFEQTSAASNIFSDARSFLCQIAQLDSLYVDGSVHEIACIYEKDFLWPIDNFPKDLSDYYLSDITQGELWMEISPARLRRSRLKTTNMTDFVVVSSTLPPPSKFSIKATVGATATTSTVQNATLFKNQPIRLAVPATGIKTVYIVRIETNDSVPTYSLDQMLTQTFGEGSAVSVRNQYLACSFGKLILNKAGGMTVKVNAPVKSFNGGAELVNQAIAILKSITKVTYVETLADKIMFVCPPGTNGTGWLANAVVGGYRSTYNDKWGNSLSAVIHELGHNFGRNKKWLAFWLIVWVVMPSSNTYPQTFSVGLQHSGIVNGTELDASYGDKTGYLGYGTISSTTPLKCFNGFKSYQFGWYSTNELRLTKVSTPRKVTLVPFVNFNQAGTKKVLANIMDIYFVSFNRAKNFNFDTGDKKNMVTVTQNTPSKSLLVAGLGVGERFEDLNFISGQPKLVIEVCQLVYDDRRPQDVDYAVISIGLGQSYCTVNLKQLRLERHQLRAQQMLNGGQ